MNVTTIFISALAGISVMLFGAAIIMVTSKKNSAPQERLKGVSGQFSPMPGAPEELAAGSGLSGALGSVGTFISSGKSSKTLSEQLTQAGYHHVDAAAVYMGSKVLLLLLGFVFTWMLLFPTSLTPIHKVEICGGVGFLLFMLPNAHVSAQRTKRRREIRSHLPEAVDLLEVCASSGMGLDMAWNCVTDEIRHVSETLADEMALTNLEIQLGAARTDSMRHMASRTGAEELSSMVAVLVQSERFGTSISEALQTFAGFLRETSGQAAQEAAEKMAVKLIFPMVVFIFPAIVAIMIGPAFISLFHALKAK